jgi:hypothetical protein
MNGTNTVSTASSFSRVLPTVRFPGAAYPGVGAA